MRGPPIGAAGTHTLAGAVSAAGATKGILVSTAGYDPDAYEAVDGRPLELIDGTALITLLAFFIGYHLIMGIGGVLVYAEDLFEAATVKRLLGHFERVLGGVASQPDISLKGAEILTEEETQLLARRIDVREFDESFSF